MFLLSCILLIKNISSLVLALMFSFSTYAADRSPNDKQWRFWGTDAWTSTTCNDDCCTTNYYEDYYVLGINTGTTYVGFTVECW